ncbi:hypothetical protein GQ607_015943 [Colletotrichum asianum]|uniref:Uncharacterized protein n=1 Tax=Colletotrichum asianum TaxID=702518 RepID=A0A8H3VYS2_9PEZI|nr:hypothetical protein GQ607_015943 [Colletotrichum asianum]
MRCVEMWLLAVRVGSFPVFLIRCSASLVSFYVYSAAHCVGPRTNTYTAPPHPTALRLSARPRHEPAACINTRPSMIPPGHEVESRRGCAANWSVGANG